MTNEQKIKEACCRANPFDMGERSKCILCDLRMCICPNRGLDGDWYEKGRDIHLADVLLAISKNKNHSVNDVLDLIYDYWNLRKDSLSDQTEQTKQFLAELLDKE